VTAPVCRIDHQVRGLPKPEYQILTSRPPLDSWLFESGARPTVRAAASLVSKIHPRPDPYRRCGVGRYLLANNELGIASRSEAAIVSRLMPGGLSIRV